MSGQDRTDSPAARAAETRRRKATEKAEAYARENILVYFNGSEFLRSFATKDDSVATIVQHLMDGFGVHPDDGGLGDDDMVLWNSGRIVAVIRKGPDGKPVPTVFDGAGTPARLTSQDRDGPTSTECRADHKARVKIFAAERLKEAEREVKRREAIRAEFGLRDDPPPADRRQD